MRKQTKHKKVLNIQTTTVCMSTMLVLLVLGAMLFFVFLAQGLSQSVREKLSFSIVLKENIGENEAMLLQKSMQKKPFVSQCVYVSKEQILKEQTEELGTNPSEFLGYNPYTSSIEINLKSDYTNSDSIVWIQQLILKDKRVSDVVYHKELVDVVNENVQKINAVLLLFAVLMTLISYSLINSMVKLTVFSKRFLLHTMKLVGADWSFIRKPFIWSALRIGLCSGVLANILLILSIYLLIQKEPGFQGLITWEMIASIAGIILVFGVMIIMFCVFISVNKFLRMKANDLYNV